MPRTTARRRNVFTHLTAAVVVPGCVALCWWQVTRALSGNTLSWAYVFEWPIFGGYAVFMWWKLIHEPPAGDRTGTKDSSSDTGPGPEGTASDAVGLPHRELDRADDHPATEDDEELASYNRYLAALHDSGKRKRW